MEQVLARPNRKRFIATGGVGADTASVAAVTPGPQAGKPAPTVKADLCYPWNGAAAQRTSARDSVRLPDLLPALFCLLCGFKPAVAVASLRSKFVRAKCWIIITPVYAIHALRQARSGRSGNLDAGWLSHQAGLL